MNLNYPVSSPINQSNLFGADPAYYEKVLGTNGHPGLDFECPLYTPIYAPCDGDAFYAEDKYHGDGIYIRTPNNSTPTANIILWHLPPREDTAHWVIPNGQGVVTHVTRGQLIGYSGNSGFPQESNGPHLHLAFMPCDSTGGPLYPNNGFHGCVDPLPMLTKPVAEVIPVATVAVNEAALITNEIATAPISQSDKLSLLDSIKVVLIKIANLLGFHD